MTSYPIVQHLERSAAEKALLRPHLKHRKTDPRAWKRGTIIRVPHVEPIVPSNHAPDPSHIPWVKDISIMPRIRLAVIVAVFRSSMITLPIFDQRTRDYEYTRLRTTSMHIKPRSKKLYDAEPLPDPTDKSLYIRGSYEPEPEAYLELTRPLSVEFSWPFHYVDQLDAESAALLQQRYRVCHNTGFAPLGDQQFLFRQQATMEPIPPIDPRLHLPADMFYGNFVCFVQQEGQMLDTISDGILHDYDGKPTSDAQVFLDDIRANHGMIIPIDERELTDKQRRMATMHGTNPSSKMRRRETIVGLRKDSRGQLRWHVRLLSISEGPMTSLQTLQPFDPARYRGRRSVARNYSSQISPGTRVGPTRHSLVAPRPVSLVNADGGVVGRGSGEVVGQAALSQAVEDLVASEAPESNTQTRGRKRRRIQQN